MAKPRNSRRSMVTHWNSSIRRRALRQAAVLPSPVFPFPLAPAFLPLGHDLIGGHCHSDRPG